MSRTYKAAQATQPGKLEVVERAIIEPSLGQVRIRVEACGVCHSDALAVEGGHRCEHPKSVDSDLLSTEAAPLLCAGLTTFNALRNSKARPGELVAIQGVGGLGHLGIQFARRMSFRVAAIARGSEKESLVKKLGAHHYIDAKVQEPVAALQALGGARLILATAANC